MTLKNIFFCLSLLFYISLFSQNEEENKGIQLFQEKKYQQAIDLFNVALQNNPKNPQIYFYRGTCYLLLQKPSIALVDFNQYLSQESKVSEAYLHRGLAHQSLKNYTFAHEDFLLFKQLNPNNVEVIKYLVYLMNEMQETDFGIQYCSELIEKEPRNIEFLKKRALLHLKNDSLSLSIKDINQCIELNNNDTNAWIMKGNIFFDAGEYSQAIDAYNLVLMSFPDHLSALVNRADAYVSMALYNEAIKDFKNLLIFKSYDVDFLYNLGFCYLQIKDYQSSVDYFSKALEHSNEQIANVLTFRGVALFNLNLIKEACFDWNKAKAMGYKEAEKYLINYCH
jgi:tetratricopeptide (TPR) repeat protein